MKGTFRIAICIAACMTFVYVGCAKKQTKVAPAVEPPASATEPVAPPHVPSDEDEFKPVDMDAKMKEVLLPVYFEYDKWDLSTESIDKLEKIASFLKENITVRLLVEGHADERGTNEYNIGLGENRAKVVKDYLISYGVSASRLEHTSYGREKPAVPNCADEPCHEKNRRVEWLVLAK